MQFFAIDLNHYQTELYVGREVEGEEQLSFSTLKPRKLFISPSLESGKGKNLLVFPLETLFKWQAACLNKVTRGRPNKKNLLLLLFHNVSDF